MEREGLLKQYGLLSFVLVAGIVISTSLHIAIRENESNRADLAFRTLASNCANVIVAGFYQTFFAIESVGALYGSSHNISSRQFDDFVAPLLDRFPTIKALSWVPRVDHSERQEFKRTAQQLFPGFRITERNAQNEIVESSDRQAYFPVYLIRPYEGNEAAHGFDIYSNPVRRAAIDHARNFGQTTSTARIRLVQERSDQYSVLIIHPVFRHGGSTKGRNKLLGVASAVYRIGDGVKKALSQVHSEGLNIWLFDRSAESDKQFLYFHPSRNLEPQQKKELSPPANARQYVHEFKLGGRNFELIMSSEMGHFEFYGGYAAWLALVIGLGFTALITAYLVLMLRRSRDLMAGQQALQQQINERMSAEQKLREANRTLEDLSRKDPVMGIANRRYFDEHFRNEWLRATRDGTSLSLLIGDIDFFKAYNDTYGHVAGDKCLQKIAGLLSILVGRPGDLAARYGGEEIAIILPSTTETGAHNIAEKVRRAVFDMALPHEQSSVAKVVTMSIGCGTAFPKQESSMENFVRAVDAALYRAKQQGRNQTIFAKKTSGVALQIVASHDNPAN